MSEENKRIAKDIAKGAYLHNAGSTLNPNVVSMCRIALEKEIVEVLTAKDAQIAELKTQLHQYQSKTVNVVAFHKLEDENAELRREVELDNSLIAHLKESAETYKTVIHNLEAKNESLKETLRKADISIIGQFKDAWEEKMKRLESELAKADAREKETHDKLLLEVSASATFRAENARLKEDSKRLVETAQNAHAKKSVLEAELAEAQRKNLILQKRVEMAEYATPEMCSGDAGKGHEKRYPCWVCEIDRLKAESRKLKEEVERLGNLTVADCESTKIAKKNVELMTENLKLTEALRKIAELMAQPPDRINDPIPVKDYTKIWVAVQDILVPLLSCSPAEAKTTDEWVIWSNEHQAWWRPNGRGYTLDWKEAGLYTTEEADKIIKGSKMPDGKPKEQKVDPRTMHPGFL